MRLLCWAAGLAAAAAAGVFAATYVMIKQNMRPERARDLSRPEERAGRRWEPYAGQLDEGIAHIRAAAWEERWITSFDGLRLHGRLLRGEGARSVLLVHGYHSSGENDFCGIFDYYASRGYNILLIDQRGHALSEGRELAYGLRERRDVLDWARALARELGGEIWLHGVSMGGAAVLMAAGLGLPEEVSGLIADSAFTSPRDILAYNFSRRYALPRFPFIELGTLAGIAVLGRGFTGARTPEAAARSGLPVLVVHGGGDRTVPLEMAREIAAACGGRGTLLVVPGAKHALCYLAAPELYSAALDAFLGEEGR